MRDPCSISPKLTVNVRVLMPSLNSKSQDGYEIGLTAVLSLRGTDRISCIEFPKRSLLIFYEPNIGPHYHQETNYYLPFK